MTEWSDWDGPITNRFRVGVDLSRSGGTVTATYRAECTQAINQEITLNRSGALTGSVNFRMNHGSSGGTTVVGSYTRSISAGQTLTFGASLSGVYNGASPSVSGVQISRPDEAPVPPSAPGRPTVDSVSSSSVTVTFGVPSSTGGAPVTNHQFQFATDSSFTNEVAAPQFTGGRTYTQGGLTPGSTYWVRARVFNVAGWGAWSPSRSFSTLVTGPSAPVNVQVARVSDWTQRISWTNNTSSVRPYTGLQLQRRVVLPDGWSAWVTRQNLGPTVTTVVDATGPNRRYQYRVRARNDAGWSDFAGSTVIDTTPSPPQGVQAVATAAGNRVEWQQGSLVPTATRVERQEDSGAWVALTLRGSGWEEALHANPSLTVTHRYRLRHEGQGTPPLDSSWAYTNRLELAAPPAAPTNLGPSGAWDATEDRELRWTHVPTDGSEQAAFQVEHRPQGGSWTAEAVVASSVSRWTLPGGTYANGDSFEWRVRTWGRHPDPSPWSVTSSSTPSARPTVAINSPSFEQVVDTSTLLVSWGYGQDQELEQAAWRVRLLLGGVVVVSRDGAGDTSQVSIANLDNNAAYRVEVEVQSSSGLWSAVDVVDFSTDFLPPQAPNIDVSWDVALGAAVVALEQPPFDEDFVPAVFLQLWRAIDEGPWLLIADGVEPGTAVVDPIPAIGDGHVNHYRATAVSDLPSTADSAVVPLTVTAKDARGWVYLNGGPGMSTVCRVRANATRSDSEGVAKMLHHFAGRPAPVEYAGTARSREWDVSARIAPDYDGASTREELVDMQALPAPVCYRDPLGARWFASMGPVSSSWRSIMGEVSWSMTEVDVTEGLAVQQRDTSQDDAA